MGFVSGLKRITVDAWSWLNYKAVFSDPRGMPHRQAHGPVVPAPAGVAPR